MNRKSLLLLALLAGGLLLVGGSAAAQDYISLGDDHGLATDDAADQYESEGAVQTNVTRIDMQVGIYSTADAAGVDRSRLELDVASHFLCADYNEDLSRTVRMEIPAGYWHPHPQQDLQALDADATMDMSPSDNLNSSVVTMQFDGKTSACWEISREAAVYFQIRDESRSLIEEETGWEIPSVLGSGSEFQYMDSSTLRAEDTIPIEGNPDDLTIQYDELANQSENERWISVSACDGRGSDDAVCRLDNAADGHAILVVQSGDPPAVRYTSDASVMDRAEAVVDDLRGAPDRAKSWLNNFLDDLI